jgi:hypothetical protein
MIWARLTTATSQLVFEKTASMPRTHRRLFSITPAV